MDQLPLDDSAQQIAALRSQDLLPDFATPQLAIDGGVKPLESGNYDLQSAASRRSPTQIPSLPACHFQISVSDDVKIRIRACSTGFHTMTRTVKNPCSRKPPRPWPRSTAFEPHVIGSCHATLSTKPVQQVR